jgi:hypothetical protein
LVLILLVIYSYQRQHNESRQTTLPNQPGNRFCQEDEEQERQNPFHREVGGFATEDVGNGTKIEGRYTCNKEYFRRLVR